MNERIAIIAAVFLGTALVLGLTWYLANLENMRLMQLQRRVKIRPRRRTKHLARNTHPCDRTWADS